MLDYLTCACGHAPAFAPPAQCAPTLRAARGRRPEIIAFGVEDEPASGRGPCSRSGHRYLAADSAAQPHVSNTVGCASGAGAGYFLLNLVLPHARACIKSRSGREESLSSTSRLLPILPVFLPHRPAAHPGWTSGPPSWMAWGPGGQAAGGPWCLGLREADGGCTAAPEEPKGRFARGGAAESRLNHPLQGLGVSYPEEAGQGCGLAGAAHRDWATGPGAGSGEERRGRARSSS